MNYDRILFNGPQKKEGGMRLELGDDASYPVKELGFISFQIPSGVVLELNDDLCIPSLKKNILSFSCIIEHQYGVAFEEHWCIIDYYSLASLRTFSKSVTDGGLYWSLANPMELVHFNMKLDEPYRCEDAYIEHVWKYLCSKPVVELVIDSRFVVDGSVVECRDKIIRFS
jgi:hypothetical protein